MAPKKVSAVFILTLALLLLAPAAWASLQFDVSLGYDDIVPERSWFPITCELNNDGPSFSAVIEVSGGGLNATPIRRMPLDLPTNTRKRVYLPIFSSGNSWDVRLLDDSGHVIAEQSVQTAYKPALRGFPVVAGLARNFAGLPVFPDISTRQQQTAKFTTARLQTATFPDNPLALEGINVLYLNSSKALELSVPQVEALVAWVENGGHLVVGLEQVTDVNSTPWLRNLLPCDVSSIKDAAAGAVLNAWLLTSNAPPSSVQDLNRRLHAVAGGGFVFPSVGGQKPRGIIVSVNASGVSYETNLIGAAANARGVRQYWMSNADGAYSHMTPSAFANFLARRVNAANASANQAATNNLSPEFDSAVLQIAAVTPRDGSILIGDFATPLAVQSHHGKGLITALAFSPEREPFLSWDGRARFWTRLAGIPPSMFDQQQSDYVAGRNGSDGLFGAMIDSKQVHKLPLGWLLLLLAAYLVVIGPLDQYWLKKINRQMLTWITFPCYVVFFSGLIYWIGFHLRNGELEWNELNVVDVLDSVDGAVFRGQTYLSIYSPVNGHYKLASDQPYATVRGEFGGAYGQTESSHAPVTQRGNAFVADAFVPVWTSQLFVSDWMQRGPAPVAFSLERSNSVWIATVDNNLDHKIGPLRLALEGRIYELGDLEGNSSRTNVLDSARAQTLDVFLNPFISAFRSAVQQRQSNFGNNSDPLPDIAGAATAASFLSSLNQSASEYEDFSSPAGLDLSRYARSGYGVLLAWDNDHSLTTPIGQFTAKRAHRRTLMRMITPLPNS